MKEYAPRCISTRLSVSGLKKSLWAAETRGCARSWGDAWRSSARFSVVSRHSRQRSLATDLVAIHIDEALLGVAIGTEAVDIPYADARGGDSGGLLASA
jgi:hypothetical protein